jgi:FkbM family methyltransferase
MAEPAPIAAIDHSQMGEQSAILEWAAAQPQPGSFIDLGAYDGASYSNTAALGELGWSGICVDAAPDAAGACAALYAERPDVAVILAAFAVDETPGAITIHWSPGAMYSAITASRRSDTVLVPIEVPRLDLGWFAERVQQLPGPLFCSVDLEGASLDALAWLLAHADPACICIEANNPTDRDAARSSLDGWAEVPLPGNHVNLVFVRTPVLA